MDKRLLWFGLAIFGVIVIAIAFRFYDLQQYPPGLFPDVAANGEDALSILEGDYRAFYSRNNGREGLLFYLDALSLKYLGIGVWQLYIPTAVIGVLTVIAIYFATQAFFGRLGGVLAALFVATSAWHVTLSRGGFRAMLAPLFLAAFTAFVGYMIQAAKDGRRVTSYVLAVLAGLAFAGGFYSYIAYRAVVGALAGVAVLLLIAAMHEKIGFPHFRRYGGEMVVGLVVALAALAPLGWYFYQHPTEAVGRAGQVSIFNETLQQQHGDGTIWGTLVYSTRETITGFFVGDGDRNFRHSVAGYPLLNSLVGLLFLFGLVWAIGGTVSVFWRIAHGEEVHLGMIFPYLLLLLLAMLVPVVTTAEGIPHGLRSLGLLVPIMMLAGAAGAVVIHYVQRLTNERGRAIAYGLIAGALVVFSVYDGALYFFAARNTAEAHQAYRGDLTEVANFIREYRTAHPDMARLYLVIDDFSATTVHFLQHGAQDQYTLVRPEESEQVALAPGDILIFTRGALSEADRYAASHPDAVLLEARRNRFGEEIMRVYQAAAEAANPAETPVPSPTFDLDA